MKNRGLEFITIIKLQLLGQAQQSLQATQILLTLSALLVGNCLTVARVGIIMISLDHGDICLDYTIMKTIMPANNMLDPTRFRIAILDFIDMTWGNYTIYQVTDSSGRQPYL